MTPPAAASATITEVGLLDVDPGEQLEERSEGRIEARLLGHAYDGIREYDNPMPGWWKAIFWATIVFSAGYGAYYHLAGWGQMPAESYRAALATYGETRVLRDRAEAANVSEGALARKAADPVIVEQGRALFVARCASCHTENGRGLIGPNLTDQFQIRGETRMDLHAAIKGGVPGTAMLAWGEQLPASDVVMLAAFVSSVRGQNLVGKPREGRAVGPFAP